MSHRTEVCAEKVTGVHDDADTRPGDVPDKAYGENQYVTISNKKLVAKCTKHK